MGIPLWIFFCWEKFGTGVCVYECMRHESVCMFVCTSMGVCVSVCTLIMYMCVHVCVCECVYMYVCVGVLEC